MGGDQGGGRRRGSGSLGLGWAKAAGMVGGGGAARCVRGQLQASELQVGEMWGCAGLR